MNPQISVIFPIGNREDYLREALESILAQTFADFELLLVLDGVSPQIKAVIATYTDPRIRVIDLPVNMGPSAARNAGLRVARGAFIALMDSDDVSMPERFSRQYAWLQGHPDVTVCASNAIKLTRDGQRASMRYPEMDGMIKARLLIVDAAILNPTTMFRSAFLAQHSLQYDPGFPRDHDHRLFVEMLRKGACFYGLQEELLLYRRHPGNLTADRSGVDEEKSRVRELLLPVFFPKLTGEDYQLILRGLHEQVNMTIDEAFSCVAALQKALGERRSLIGEDRDELHRILGHYRQRTLQSLKQTLVSNSP